MPVPVPHNEATPQKAVEKPPHPASIVILVTASLVGIVRLRWPLVRVAVEDLTILSAKAAVDSGTT